LQLKHCLEYSKINKSIHHISISTVITETLDAFK